MLGRIVEETFAELLYVSPLRNIYWSAEHGAPLSGARSRLHTTRL